MGNENRTSAPSGAFETADGALNIAANKQEQFEALCRALHREELIEDPRFLTREDRKRNRDLLRSELEISLKAKSATDWDAVLLDTGVPAAPVVSVPEALASEQIEHRGLISEVPLPASRGGTIRVVGLPTHVDGSPVAASSPPPRLGQHTDEVLAGLGYTTEQIDELRHQGAV
jgi:crotonobetainyl-CoA:carnitine CoA-transferase CaiB-like acyl-CoA transferase